MNEKKKDFNQVVNQTINHLKLCVRDDSGQIYWAPGTVEMVFELLTYLPDSKEDC